VLQIELEQCIIVVLGVTKKMFCIMYYPVLKVFCFKERNYMVL